MCPFFEKSGVIIYREPSQNDDTIWRAKLFISNKTQTIPEWRVL